MSDNSNQNQDNQEQEILPDYTPIYQSIPDNTESDDNEDLVLNGDLIFEDVDNDSDDIGSDVTPIFQGDDESTIADNGSINTDNTASPYQCPVCSMGFSDEVSLNDHCMLSHSWGMFIIDPPSVSFGNFSCPVCHSRFLTGMHLNQHFNVRHMNYSDMVDIGKADDYGFPGFSVLELAGVVMRLVFNKTLHDECCPVCRENYDNDNFPVRYQCCDKLLCQTCCYELVRQRGSIVCPFCLCDHENNHPPNTYLVFYEAGDTNSSWNEWWKKRPILWNKINTTDENIPIP